uniref:GATA-type domain-containing protein n=1 Tax=Meloidogyne enterolobii TaxID=390850 RepID=A0A6V7VVD7_MELEN|nr:unnamed protein product [Meloidogyne enterolobii]
MIKLIIASYLYLLTLLNIKCDGKKVSIEVKIKDDWEEKREFIYLKNVELEERFVLEKIVKKNNQHDTSYNYNIEGFLRRIEVNSEGNYYIVEIDDRSEYAEELKRRVLINIANNKILQNIHFGFEKQLLSSYWMEINLIGYKIELLEKQKVEYPKEELKSRIIHIGSEIRGIIERNKRNCFNCRFINTVRWYKYLKEHYLCQTCHEYKIYNGKMRPQGRMIQNKMVCT